MITAIDLGGSHVSAARIDERSWMALADVAPSFPLDPGAGADELIAVLARAATSVGDLAGTRLCLAVPGPFDYGEGIARYAGVGKFDALNGVDVRRALMAALDGRPAAVTFVGDAVAFTVGEWLSGAGRGVDRLAGITLGTGVGSGFLDRGRPVLDGPSVPPEGRIDLIRIGGRPLEDTVSTRAVIRAHGRPVGGVADVVRAGDLAALDAYRELGLALAPWLVSFGADAVVVGGGVARSWEVIGPLLRAGLADGGVRIPVRAAEHPGTATHIGAAWLGHR